MIQHPHFAERRLARGSQRKLDAVHWQIVCGRMTGFQHSVTFRRIRKHRLFPIGTYPDDSETTRRRQRWQTSTIGAYFDIFSNAGGLG